MGDLQPIHSVIARARRRLRLMAALDAATTFAILGVSGTLVVLWLRRMELLDDRQGTVVIAGLGAAVVVAALARALRRLPLAQVATRTDRASGLADRLGTACDFSARLTTPDDELHPATRALMERAIADGVAAVPRADVRRAAPFHVPRDARALAAFTTIAAIVTLLRFGPEPDRALAAAAAAAPSHATPPAEPKESLDPDDLDYQRQFVEDMKQLATQTKDPSLLEMSEELTALLDKAEKGEIGKQELIARMETLEQKYTAGKGNDLDRTVADLKDQGRQLKQNPVTRKLGEAMEAGDLDTAKQELDKLADKMDKAELKPQEQKQLAEALEKAADQQEKKDQREEKKEQQEAQQKIDKQKEEVRRLEKKAEQKPEDEQLRRTLQKEKRELERLEREEQARKDKPERQLDRLTRNMKRAAESLKQKNQSESSQNLRKTADEARKMQDEMRRMGNQKKVQSQLNDLKEAIRRAKPRKGGQGQRGQQQARMQRIQEWEKRAGGQRGNAQAWRGQGQQPGDSPGNKEAQLGKGQQQSQQFGDEHDPNVTADPTARFGKTKDERLAGVHGQGPSRRETILTSAKKGFAQQGYKQVYTDYRKAAEEVMSKEKVPQGYKYYVKRYFQRIKPHAMD